MTAQFKIGDSPRRREDARFVTGGGAYLDDLPFPQLAHAVFVRSPHPHAIVRGIDTAAAKQVPGVLAVLTIHDADADGLQPMRPGVEVNVQTGEPFAFMPQPLLARDKVRFVGEPVVLVVAETKAQALDAAEWVAVDYAPLASVSTPEAARAPGAPQIADAVPGNLCLDWRHGDTAAVDTAFAQAAHLITQKFVNHRIVTNPMEPRGIVAAYDAIEDRYTAHVSAQAIHNNRDFAARWLGVTPDKVRFIMPDVGGGFGAKNMTYAEHALIPWAARRIGRPVKWIATRSEVFLTDHQARDHHAEATLALDEAGRFLGLRVSSVACLGGYMAGGAGGLQTFQYPHLQGTIYALPAVEILVSAVLTNQTPIGVTRGPGFGETVNILERLIDVAAAQCGFDRADLRRRNMVRAFPMTNAFGFVVDGGHFSECFEGALANADLPGFVARRAANAEKNALRGLGFACHIKGTGGPPSENVDIRFESDGTVSLITGTVTIGQGHETTFPQILAHRLGIANDRIRLRQGDTDMIPMGGGHGSSRATYMGGTAMWLASDTIIQKGTVIAAKALDAEPSDISFDDGLFLAAGTNRSIDILTVAALARAANTPLDTYHHWTRDAMTFPNGTHVAEVEIDRDTGRVTLERYTAMDDYGVLVNPMVASGQAHGAIAQGSGQALMEHAVYDPTSGQPVAASFMDYALPRAADLPSFDLSFNGTPCTTNPLGVKGAGEAGAVGGFPAVANAILDALEPFGVKGFDGPATPFRIWRAMREGQ